MHEVKYFLEDHWLKLLIGVVIVGILIFIFSGENEQQQTEEVNNTGMITEGNYESQAEESGYTAEYEAELEEEDGDDSGSSSTNHIIDDSEEIKAEDVDYSEESEFELVGDLVQLKEKYKGNDYKDVMNNFDKDEDVVPASDVLRNKVMYDKYGKNTEGCINNNNTYESCVSDILSEMKWLSGDRGDELDNSYNIVGTSLANQTVFLDGMKESNTGGLDLDNVYEALEIALYIRGSILKDFDRLEGMEQSERDEVEDRVKTRFNELSELEKFVDNYWSQVMVSSTED